MQRLPLLCGITIFVIVSLLYGADALRNTPVKAVNEADEKTNNMHRQRAFEKAQRYQNLRRRDNKPSEVVSEEMSKKSVSKSVEDDNELYKDQIERIEWIVKHGFDKPMPKNFGKQKHLRKIKHIRKPVSAKKTEELHSMKEELKSIKKFEHEAAKATHRMMPIDMVMSTDSERCMDKLGNVIEKVAGRPDLYTYVTVTLNGPVRISAACDNNKIFSLESCHCESMDKHHHQVTDSDKNLALIYMDFEKNLQDNSIHHFPATVGGIGRVVRVDTITATPNSRMAARFNDAHLTIQSRLKYKRVMQEKASWCTFFRCEQQIGSTECVLNGGLIMATPQGRRSEVDSSFSLNVERGNTIVAKLAYGMTADKVNVLTAKFDTVLPGGFVHVCVVHGNEVDRLFINKALVDERKSRGLIMPVSGPYSIGFSKSAGHFSGIIDDVLIVDKAMPPTAIIAHGHGDVSLLARLGYIEY